MSNLEIVNFKFTGWKSTALLIAVWWTPAIAGFALGYLCR